MDILKAPVVAIAQAIIANKDYLTELDAAIGDGDHGINMARGFTAVAVKIADADVKDIGAVLKLVGMTLISTVGGASGPLYGTAFLRAAALGQSKITVDNVDISHMLEAAIKGIKDRGKAHEGEKTMLDALEPAYRAFKESATENKSLAQCLTQACVAAQEGLEFTKTIVATKGRASYLGERSLGHQDPGATSSYIMLCAFTEYCRSGG